MLELEVCQQLDGPEIMEEDSDLVESDNPVAQENVDEQKFVVIRINDETEKVFADSRLIFVDATD